MYEYIYCLGYCQQPSYIYYSYTEVDVYISLECILIVLITCKILYLTVETDLHSSLLHRHTRHLTLFPRRNTPCFIASRDLSSFSTTSTDKVSLYRLNSCFNYVAIEPPLLLQRKIFVYCFVKMFLSIKDVSGSNYISKEGNLNKQNFLKLCILLEKKNAVPSLLLDIIICHWMWVLCSLRSFLRTDNS